MRRAVAAAILIALACGAQRDDKAKPVDRPAVTLILPLGVTPGRAAKLTVRGRKLDDATEARLAPPVAPVRLVTHEKSPPPEGLDAGRFGDSRVVVEFDLPADAVRDPLALIVTTTAGETDPHPIRLDPEPPTPEREPNGGFRESQPLEPATSIEGIIAKNQDVDVYRFRGEAGDRASLAILARRRGSALDPLLSLYDDRGYLIATADDPGSRGDPTLAAVLPAAGVYHAVVMDAHDKGSPLHAYRLQLRVDRGRKELSADGADGHR